jgi:hypothetical protein
MGSKSVSSVKERALNHILDMISSGRGLRAVEKHFLDIQQSIPDSEMKDHMMVSSVEAGHRVSSILGLGIGVTCNLRDRDGMMGADVLSSEVLGDIARLTLSGHTTVDLLPSLLYDLTFSVRDFRYSLESGQEFFELATIKK